MPPRRSGRNNQPPAQQASLIPDSLISVQSDVVESYSAATLPPRYTITLALPPDAVPLDEGRQLGEYIRGEEALSDAWRRDQQEEGRLETGWSGSGMKRRKLNVKGEVVDIGKEGWKVRVKSGEVPLWYTSGLFFPCLCQLDRWSYSYTPRFPAPRAQSLHPLPPHDTPSEAPIPITALPEWSTTISGDLEPGLDELKAFDPLWKVADGGWGRGWGCDEIMESQGGAPGPSGAKRDDNGELVLGTLTHHPEKSIRKPVGKGKGKTKSIPIGAMEFRMPLIPAKATPPVLPTIGRQRVDLENASPIDLAISAGPVTEGDDWQAESKRRRALWRGMIQDDAGYGRMWEIIERPHSYSPLPHFAVQYDRPQTPRLSRPPNFVLPRALSTSCHPFHPSLSSYISSHPHARLHWIIPIHGPVFVPSINSPPAPSSNSGHPLTPSSASLSANRPVIDPATRPFPLLWTPEVLRRFMQLLLSLYRDKSQPMGAISIRLSGPKPDPFLDLPDPPLLVRHHHVPKGVKGSRPVRAECGDHIRVYVDAKYALAFRTWLYALEIPHAESDQARDEEYQQGLGRKGGTTQSGGLLADETGKMDKVKGRGERVFHKTRLTLIGEKGEVLVVA